MHTGWCTVIFRIFVEGGGKSDNCQFKGRGGEEYSSYYFGAFMSAFVKACTPGVGLDIIMLA